MQKQVNFQALGVTADEALHQALLTPEFVGFSVLGIDIRLIDKPDAVKKTLDFIEMSGTTLPGYTEGAREIKDLKLWSVSVTLEYTHYEPAFDPLPPLTPNA
jgi:hypothetical protein